MGRLSGHLVTFRNDRLGGRLISLLNTMRIARDHDLPFRVRWHENDDIARVFNDPELFFEAGFVAEHFISAEDWAAERAGATRLRELDDRTAGGVRAFAQGGGIVLIDGSFGHDCLVGEDAEAVAQSAADLWARFPLAPAIRDAAEAIRDRVGENALGYHVRRGDLITSTRVMNRPWPQKYVFDEIYFRHLDKVVDEGRKPILFSDDPDTVARYRARYPGLVPASELYDPDGFEEGQRDLLELIAMSCCSDIVAPALSGFSSTAATLGGIRHQDVLQALSDEEIEAAHEDMVARLSSAAPETTVETGHVSQSLAHAEPWLIARDRAAEAERILSRLIDDGLDISYLYPRLVMLRLDLGDAEGALAAHAHVDSREVHFSADVALADACGSLAAHALGRPDEAARLARRAFWQAGSLPQVSAIIAAMMSRGILDDTNFFPTDDAARQLWLHPATRLSDRPGILRTLDCADEKDMPQLFSTNPILWDWFPLIRPVPALQLRRHPHRRQHEAGLERLEATEAPGALALAALYDALVESEAGDPLDRLREIAEAAPDAPMVHHRLSVAAAKLKDRDAALWGAERAAELCPDTPAFIAWRGITRGQAGDRDGEQADLERAILDLGFSLPRLPLRLCAAGRKSGDTDIQARAHELAVHIAPRDAASRLGRAVFHAQSGATDAALRDLEIVLRHDVVPPNATALFARLTARQAVAS